MPRAKRVRCFYCGEFVLASRIEHDHFPVPESCGGTVKVPACGQCHDLKDRTNWEDLPLEFKADFMEEFSKLRRGTKIVFAMVMRTYFEVLKREKRRR